MDYQSEFRNRTIAGGLLQQIKKISEDLGLVQIMEVCGSHTMAICRFGIRQLLPRNISLLSGPGCPVCVSPGEYLDKAIALSRLPNVVLSTFGDMFRVPGSTSSLQQEKERGANIEIAFSPLESVELAKQNPDKKIVFLGIGFETTTPSVAMAVKDAKKQGLKNYFVLCGHKTMPNALHALAAGSTSINGFICPGHVSTIIGTRPYEFLARDYGIGCVVAGFEPLDILQAIYMLLVQIEEGMPTVENQYTRLVKPDGNKTAQKLVEEVFEPADVPWRGLGIIPESGLKFRDEYKEFDAEQNIEFTPEPTIEKRGCICGEILQGMNTPHDCPLFGINCTPVQPVGPCMVSSEGCCAAAYKYLGKPLAE